MKLKTYLFLILYFLSIAAYSWNKQGHQVVAQIAYDHLTPKALAMSHKYLHLRAANEPEYDFIHAATWLDQLRHRGISWYDMFHYIDIPFATDGTPLPAVEHSNALWAMSNARTILTSKKTSIADKRLALMILIHVSGDIHQPLHTTTRVSKQYPRGDLGGNLFVLGTNKVGKNLHKYWDNGAGWLQTKDSYKSKARALEKKWTCAAIDLQIHPEKWIDETHAFAISQVYQLNPHDVPGKQYQQNAQDTVKKQLVLAGCRLAILVNDIAENVN